MKRDKLIKPISSLTEDIDFKYKGEHGAVCPFSRTDILVSCGNNEHRHI